MKTKTLTAIALMLFSCGAQEQEDDPKPTSDPYDGYVKDYNDDDEITYYVEMPKCMDYKEEKLVYIPDEELFLVCRSGQWQFLDLNATSELPNTSNCQTVVNPVIQPSPEPTTHSDKE